MTFRHCVAVDLGASSGRVMLARYDSEHRTLTLREIHRFANCLQKQDGFDTWDPTVSKTPFAWGWKKSAMKASALTVSVLIPGAWTMS